MKNMIMYYYNFKELSSFKREGHYFFRVGKDVFSLERVANRNEITNIYQLLSYHGGEKYFKIKKNIYNDIVTSIQGYDYILVQQSKVEFNIGNEIIENNYAIMNKEQAIYSNWIELWGQKLDYYEYQMQHIFGIYPVIDESIYYFLGMGECAISYLKYNYSFENKPLYLSHRRISQDSYFHPLSVIVDYKARDISEYFKYLFYSNQYVEFDFLSFLGHFSLDYDDYILIYARLLFPSFYFDCYDVVVNARGGEDAFKEIVRRTLEYEVFLKSIHILICQIITIPKLDWI